MRNSVPPLRLRSLGTIAIKPPTALGREGCAARHPVLRPGERMAGRTGRPGLPISRASGAVLILIRRPRCREPAPYVAFGAEHVFGQPVGSIAGPRACWDSKPRASIRLVTRLANHPPQAAHGVVASDTVSAQRSWTLKSSLQAVTLDSRRSTFLGLGQGRWCIPAPLAQSEFAFGIACAAVAMRSYMGSVAR